MCFPRACDLSLCVNPLVDVDMYGKPQCHTAARLAEKPLPMRLGNNEYQQIAGIDNHQGESLV